MSYWQSRMAKVQDAVSQKNLKQVETQLRKHYKSIAQRVIKDFELTHLKVLEAIEDGKQPTPADLYKLDTYWQMQAQMQRELKSLNEKQVKALARAFEINYFEVYHSLEIKGLQAFSTIDKEAVKQVINQIWCADGKSWSQRIWENTALLQQTLNDELVQCVAAGKPPSYLKKLLQERFNVSFGRADMLVRTELAHIQTQAAKHRYRDYGIQQVEVLADKDERRCEVCGKLHGKRYSINDVMPIPAHPRCRCCMVAVVE